MNQNFIRNACGLRPRGVARLVQGPLYLVTTLTLERRLSILFENKRMITEIATDLGRILYVEIGATFVGSIHQTYTPNKRISKGDEKGYFEFGGSCIALIFEAGRIEFAKDLLGRALETRINFGEALAYKAGMQPGL